MEKLISIEVLTRFMSEKFNYNRSQCHLQISFTFSVILSVTDSMKIIFRSNKLSKLAGYKISIQKICCFCSLTMSYQKLRGFPWWLSGKDSICQCRGHAQVRFLVWKVPHLVEQLSLCVTAAEAHTPRVC